MARMKYNEHISADFEITNGANIRCEKSTTTLKDLYDMIELAMQRYDEDTPIGYETFNRDSGAYEVETCALTIRYDKDEYGSEEKPVLVLT